MGDRLPGSAGFQPAASSRRRRYEHRSRARMPALPGGPQPWQARRTGLRIARIQVVESSTWIVIPVRSLTDGKRRLAPVLGPDERADLVRRLFLRTLEAALAAGPPVLVVSPDPAALALARDHGAAGLEEPRPVELNHALELAAREAATQRGRRAPHRLRRPPGPRSGGPACYAAAAAGSGRQSALLPRRNKTGGVGRETTSWCGSPRTKPGIGTNALYVRPPGPALVRVRRDELPAAP